MEEVPKIQNLSEPAKRSFVGIVNHWFRNEQSAADHPTLAVTEQFVAFHDEHHKTWSVIRRITGRLPGDTAIIGLARNTVPAAPGVEMDYPLKSGLTLKKAYNMVRRNEETPTRPKGYPVLRQVLPDTDELPKYWRNLPRVM